MRNNMLTKTKKLQKSYKFNMKELKLLNCMKLNEIYYEITPGWAPSMYKTSGLVCAARV